MVRVAAWTIGLFAIAAAGYLVASYLALRDDPELAIVHIKYPHDGFLLDNSIAWIALETVDVDPNATTRNPCQSLLSFALADPTAEADTGAMRKVADLLIDRGANINLILCGMNALTSAIVADEPWAVSYLLDKGADPFVPTQLPSVPGKDLNALEFAKYLSQQPTHPRSIRETIAILEGAT